MIDDIINTLMELSEEKRIKFANSNYPTVLKILGVTNPNIKLVLKALKALTKDYDGRQQINIARQLLQTNIFECQQLAYDYLDKNKRAENSIKLTDIEDLRGETDNWVIADYYAIVVVGKAWQLGIIGIDRIKAFYASHNFWERRIAITSTFTLNSKLRGGKGDAVQTLEICKMAVSDHHPMIVKALSWILRDLAKQNQDAVIDFLLAYENLLHRRVLREVNNKINFGTKNVK